MSSFSAPMHPIPAIRPLERIWCEKCMRYNDEPCWNHNVHISDTVVIPYAVSSLPNQLYLDVCGNGLSDKRVLTKERLPSQTIFGPLVAPLSDTLVPPLMFACASEAGALRYFQLGSEQTVNWMKYVRFAVREGEGNVAVYARANQVFFVTMREIPAYEELRLRYSRSYAEMSGFAVPPLRSGSAASKPPLKRAVPETSKYEPKRLRTKFKSPEFVTTSDSSCDENPPSPDYPFPDNAASTPVNTSVKTTTPVQRKAIVQDTPALPSVNQTTLRKTTVLQDHRQDDANNYADTADVEPYHVPAVHEIPRKIRRKLIGYNGPQMNPAPTVPVQNVVKVMVCLPTASTARVPVLAPAPPQPPIQLVAIPAPKPPVVRIRIPRIPPPFATKMNPSRQILPKGGVVPRDEFAALSKTEPVIAVQPAPFTYEEYAVEKSANCEEPALVLVGDVVNRKNDAAEEAVDDEEQPNAKYQACRLCGHKTDTRHHRLAEHMRLRHPEYVKEHWKFPCETCGYVFATTKAVQNHVRRTHSCPKRGKSRGKRPSTEEVQTALQFIKSTGFYSYFCPDCHKHFASQPLLELHRRPMTPPPRWNRPSAAARLVPSPRTISRRFWNTYPSIPSTRRTRNPA
ncbi:PR domain zinc finger protein 1-like [Paramacrobiotus metropolitanus]|uniref:PR domain zinc finger protein 1-like n=1 Tax=Paramacrobiotus metropolitanus TaxID=2943436 RepID=UPI002445E9EF|nr:PR domain zinc finger protein 1-like [Paramacrobiotus metropolitanus]